MSAIPSSRAARKWLERDCRNWPSEMIEVPRDQWPEPGLRRPPVAVWRSNKYLAQVFDEGGGVLRVSVNRTVVLPGGRWDDGLTWDELQTIKREVGFGARFAVEVYPEDAEVVNVANMRHIWCLDEAPSFGWRRPLHAR